MQAWLLMPRPSSTQAQSHQSRSVRSPTNDEAFRQLMFAVLGFECDTCALNNAVIVAPRSWTKATQVGAFTSGELRSRPTFEGVPDAMDFVEEVTGDEYKLIVQTLSGELEERGADGVVARTEVMRDTRFTYAAGRRVLVTKARAVRSLYSLPFSSTRAMRSYRSLKTRRCSVILEHRTVGTRAAVFWRRNGARSPETATVLAFREQIDSTWLR